MKRQHSPTSTQGHDRIKPFKANHKHKICEGMEKLPVGGTFEEISIAAGMKDSQVWKRLSEMERDGTIFNTGITRKLSSGVEGIVWKLTAQKHTYANSVISQATNTNLPTQLNLL